MVTFRRLTMGLLGPSREVNQEALERSGRSSESVVISEACVEDAAAIARVHVKVFRRAHLARGPSVRIREGQWVSKLRDPSAVKFCFVANLDPEGVVGFANGAASDHPGYQARLEKIYLLPRFQGLGVGRRLVCAVARRFHELGMENMMLLSQAENPACRFFDALGGDRLLGDDGQFHGAFGWPHLAELVGRCEPDVTEAAPDT